MKKLLLIGAFITTVIASVYAQCEIDYNITTTGVYPSELPNACVNTQYEQTIQIVLPKDTTIVLQPFFPNPTQFEINTITITNIKNLPEGLVYTCHTETCVSQRDSELNFIYHCVRISGIAVTEFEGALEVEGSFTVVQVPTTEITLGEEATPAINFKVSEETSGDCITQSIETPVEIKKETSATIFPNPVTSYSKIAIYSPVKSKASIEVYDIIGQPVKSINLGEVAKGSTEFSLASLGYLNAGIYMLNISVNNKNILKKIVIE